MNGAAALRSGSRCHRHAEHPPHSEQGAVDASPGGAGHHPDRYDRNRAEVNGGRCRQHRSDDHSPHGRVRIADRDPEVVIETGDRQGAASGDRQWAVRPARNMPLRTIAWTSCDGASSRSIVTPVIDAVHW